MNGVKRISVMRPRHFTELLNRDYGFYLVGRQDVDMEETERGAVSKP
jgi:hypothetical protein